MTGATRCVERLLSMCVTNLIRREVQHRTTLPGSRVCPKRNDTRVSVSRDSLARPNPAA